VTDRDAEVTPIDRPLMRSDLDAVRRSMHEIQQFQIRVYEESKRAQSQPRMMAAICIACVFTCLASAWSTIAARNSVIRTASAAQVRP
jgi:hypothetical protein